MCLESYLIFSQILYNYVENSAFHRVKDPDPSKFPDLDPGCSKGSETLAISDWNEFTNYIQFTFQRAFMNLSS